MTNTLPDVLHPAPYLLGRTVTILATIDAVHGGADGNITTMQCPTGGYKHKVNISLNNICICDECGELPDAMCKYKVFIDVSTFGAGLPFNTFLNLRISDTVATKLFDMPAADMHNIVTNAGMHFFRNTISSIPGHVAKLTIWVKDAQNLIVVGATVVDKAEAPQTPPTKRPRIVAPTTAQLADQFCL